MRRSGLVGAAPTPGPTSCQDILEAGVVRIGVPLDVPPFGSQNANRQPEGFDVDMANMVAKALGVKLELQQITGANRIPFLLTDKVDIVISVMGLTPERAKQIMFTAPYANTSLAVFGPELGRGDRAERFRRPARSPPPRARRRR